MAAVFLRPVRLILVCLSASAFSQVTTQADAAGVVTRLNVEVPLVLVPVRVATTFGAAVTGLKREHFRVFEDDVEQKILYFAHEDAPVSVGLVLDASGSMRNKMRRSWEAAAQLRKTSNPQDEFFLIEFNERPRLAVRFTNNWDYLHQRLLRAKPLGRTSLLDAVHLALREMKAARHLRKAIVILSDGGDNHSRYTEGDIRRSVREADVPIYGIGIFDPEEAAQRTPEEQNGPALLRELTEETGGRHFPVRSLDDLPAACARIGSDLRDQYVLGYYSTNPATGGDHRLKVVLAPPEGTPPVKVYHRQSYSRPVRP